MGAHIKTISQILVILIIALVIYSCEENEKDLVGPCVHSYNEPILNITSVRDANNKPISFVILRDLKINGIKLFAQSLLHESYSIVASDSLFYCNIPFGFGVEEGTYEFIIEAEGLQPKMITIEDVKYTIFVGGCPSYSDGGTRIDILLN